MPYLFDEDAALKERLSGIKVRAVPGDGGTEVDVPVRFVHPEVEVAEMTYPIILIERTDIKADPERMHSGWDKFTRPIEGLDENTPEDTWGYYGELPVPMNIDYQVGVLCRSNVQLLELVRILARGGRMPHRLGYVKLPFNSELVPLDVLGGPEPSSAYDENGKRLFGMHYLVRVQTEVLPYDPERIELIRTVLGTITDTKTRKWDLGRFGDDQ